MEETIKGRKFAILCVMAHGSVLPNLIKVFCETTYNLSGNVLKSQVWKPFKSQRPLTPLRKVQKTGSSVRQYTEWMNTPRNKPVSPTDFLTTGKGFLVCNEITEHMMDW